MIYAKYNGIIPINEDTIELINEGFKFNLLDMVLNIILIPIKKMDKKVEKHARQVLTNELNENKNLLPLKNKLKRGTRVISVNKLAKQVKISDADMKIIDNNDISVLAMVDKDNNILAYCLIDAEYHNNKFGYTIVDKSLGNSKDLNMYVQATFEFKLGVYGDGIKYFTNKYKNVGAFGHDNNIDKDIKRTANYLNKVESEAVIKNIESISKIVLGKAKSAFSDALVYDEKRSKDSSESGFVNFYFYNDELFTKYNESGDINDDDYEKEEQILKKCSEKFESIMNGIDFKTKEKFAYVSSDDKRYRNIKISFESDDENFGYYYIAIYTNRKLYNE